MNANEIFEQILTLRKGDVEADVFLNPDYQRDLFDPWLMADMDKAVGRLESARAAAEKVTIYGDYDIDGLTASTIMREAGTAWGLDIDVYIPNRFEEGYGLNKAAITEIAKTGTTLIVTVDCGSLSVKEVAHAKQLGVDVIVTDHHAVGDVLPDAVAVLNPQRKDGNYPHTNLAGVGVAFKLIQAAMQKMPGIAKGQEKWMLDLVALGTVCDVVPLIGENRALVHWGLIVARQGKRIGLTALSQAAGVDVKTMRAVDMAFKLGPRLNASGRMISAKKSLELLGSESLAEARLLASELEAFNSQRKMEQERITDEAMVLAIKDDNPVIVLSSPDWSHGIIGIVASKIMHQLRKPTLLMQEMGDICKGSARSYGDFKLNQAVDEVRDILLSGGGHAFAAGCTVALSDFDVLKKRINDYYSSLKLSDQAGVLSPHADVAIDDADVLNMQLIELLEKLEPFGEKNPAPIFKITNARLSDLVMMGSSGKHCRGKIIDQQGLKHEFVHFNNAPELMNKLGKADLFDCFVRLEKNWFRGECKVQRQLIDAVGAN